MATRLKAVPMVPDLVDLRRLSANELDSLLEEEIRTWEETLDWDFTKSADLVRRFVDLRALNGSALVIAGEVAGYAYFIVEEHKGLIGDLYVRRALRTTDNENRLLQAVLDELIRTPYVRRIESQLMMIGSDPKRRMPGPRFLSVYDRNFMKLDLARARALPAGRVRRHVCLEKWTEHHQEATAHLIAAAYQNHIDSRINDQYRSPAGARRFLFNIIQYPGCGSFFQPASFAALDAATGRLCGLSLASLVGPQAGHITQLCAAPTVRGTGVGYELLRQSLEALRGFGCNQVSLTVTASNQQAMRLYQQVGFKTVRRFCAYVWEGF